MIYPNKYQPQRPLFDENGKALSFRTHISAPDAQYDPHSLANIICQCRLYRWVKSEFVNAVPISELHEHLFWDEELVSKKHLGSTILQTVQYDPRKLKGATKNNPKACMIYVFSNPKDLEFGLEWLICIWIWRVTLASTIEETQEALNELVSCEERDVDSLFWKPMMQPIVNSAIRPIDWNVFWNKHKLEKQSPTPAVRKRPVLRSFE